MKVFVVGNIAMDQTLAIDQMPREGASIFGVRVSSDLGGKGTNQAIVLARCGIRTILVAGIGADVQGRQMRDLLEREPIIGRLLELPDCASDSTIVLKDAAGGNANITTVDCARRLEPADVRPMIADATRGDMLVLQGNLSLTTTAGIMEEARRKGVRIVLNPSPFDAMITSLLPGLDILFLNEHEAEQITGTQDEAAVTRLLALGIGTVVLTLGSRGALLGTEDGLVSVPARSCHVMDSTGAGDTFQSVAIGSALLRESRIDARDLGIAANAAAITVSRFGTVAAFPTQEELAGLLKIDHLKKE